MAVPVVQVACENRACRAAGKQREVAALPLAPGIVGLPDMYCAACGHIVPVVAGLPFGEAERDVDGD